MRKWMSFAKAVAGAGSFEDLCALVREKHIVSRAADFFMNRSSTKRADRNIPHDWWAKDVAHDIDPAAGRACFSLDDANFGAYELLAIGIEFERGPVDARWPVMPKPVAAARKGKTSVDKKKTSAAGTKESPLWKANIVPHLKTLFPGKPYPSKNESFHAAKDWLFKNHKTMVDSTVREGIKRHFPEWFPDDDDD